MEKLILVAYILVVIFAVNVLSSGFDRRSW
jgi:hypothetical protein